MDGLLKEKLRLQEQRLVLVQRVQREQQLVLVQRVQREQRLVLVQQPHRQQRVQRVISSTMILCERLLKRGSPIRPPPRQPMATSARGIRVR